MANEKRTYSSSSSQIQLPQQGVRVNRFLVEPHKPQRCVDAEVLRTEARVRVFAILSSSFCLINIGAGNVHIITAFRVHTSGCVGVSFQYLDEEEKTWPDPSPGLVLEILIESGVIRASHGLQCEPHALEN